MREDLPSKMIVFDFSMRDEDGVVFQRHDTQRSAPVVRRESREPDEAPFGLPPIPRPEPEVPESLTTMEWVERESFKVPFCVPFSVVVDADCYFFVTNGGAIHRAMPCSESNSERTCTRIFHDPDDPIIACIHESSTNRIFAFRRASYTLVANSSYSDEGQLRFLPCDDITHSEPMFYHDELGLDEMADARFCLVSQAARVLRQQQ
jgi:hypothetical protein